MYANVRHRQFHPGKATEGARQIQAGVVPIISQAPGLLAFYVVQTVEDTSTSIGLFETQDAAEVAGPQAVAWVDQHLAALVAGPAEISSGPVLVHHRK